MGNDSSLRLVSYCLFTYNQERYIEEAVLAAFQQTYSPLQIIISDDHSTDATFKIIENLTQKYKGPHQVIINRNDKNIGLGGHFYKVCSKLATGDYIVTCAGDDISTEFHVEKAVSILEHYPNIMMVDFSSFKINLDGVMIEDQPLGYFEKQTSLIEYLKLKPVQTFAHAPGRIIRKELISSFGPINDNCPTEDSVLVFRSMLLGGFVRKNEKLVYYRTHQTNLSNMQSLKNINNNYIINQYSDDFSFFWDKGNIDSRLARLIQIRIRFELIFRNIIYCSKNNTFYKFLKYQLAKYTYKLILLSFIIYSKKIRSNDISTI
jgi:glycosyltransferase involved in cell wall biosynthesis